LVASLDDTILFVQNAINTLLLELIDWQRLLPG